MCIPYTYPRPVDQFIIVMCSISMPPFSSLKNFLYRIENDERKNIYTHTHLENGKDRKIKRNTVDEIVYTCVCDLPRDRNVISDKNDFYRSITRQEKTRRRKSEKKIENKKKKKNGANLVSNENKQKKMDRYKENL